MMMLLCSAIRFLFQEKKRLADQVADQQRYIDRLKSAKLQLINEKATALEDVKEKQRALEEAELKRASEKAAGDAIRLLMSQTIETLTKEAGVHEAELQAAREELGVLRKERGLGKLSDVPPSRGIAPASGDHSLTVIAPPLDVEDFSCKWQVFRSFVELQCVKDNKPVTVPMLSRQDVVKPLIGLVGRVHNASKAASGKGLYLFRRFLVEGFRGEDVQDDGGATYELYSLFFEQLKDLEVTIKVGASRGVSKQTVMTIKLFEVAENGTVFLPTRIMDPALRAVLQADTSVRDTYFRIGKIFAKAIIDGCPIPPAWASDFLIGYFLDEHPQQERVPISRLVHMLSKIDPGYSWVRTQLAQGTLFEGFNVGDVLTKEEEDTTPIGPHNRDAVLRKFFVEKVSGDGGNKK